MNEDNYIDGIFNYCDRWCERCTFTSRCRLFHDLKELENEMKELVVRPDSDNLEFWNDLENKARVMENDLETEKIESDFSDEDVDPEELEEYLEERERTEAEAKESVLHQLARQYLSDSQAFCLEFPDDGNTPETMRDWVEVIKWYRFFIPVKFYRAIKGKIHDDDEIYEAVGAPKDSDATAKTAMIAVNRSRHAWLACWEVSDSEPVKKIIVHCISLLDKIKLLALKEFPDAMNVIRPGLDE